MLSIKLNIDLESPLYRALHSVFEHSAEYRYVGPNIGIDLQAEFEYSAEYRLGGPNIELYRRSLNVFLSIDL